MKRTIYLAGGCFWGTQKYFDQFDGVIKTEVGYANGLTEDPSYEEVCKGSCHAETVRIDFDDTRISLYELLNYYFMVIDPTSLNQQGNDLGIQYRTGIYYTDETMEVPLKEYYKKKRQEIGDAMAVELCPIKNYYKAEEYHQDYLEKNPNGYCHIPPKMFRLAAQKKAYSDDNIRRARKEDISGLLLLLEQVDMVHHNGRPDLFKGPATKYTADELSELICDDEKPIFVFVSEDGRVLGHAFCVIQDHTADHVLTDIKTMYIDDICVDENERGHHVGQQLYRHVVQYAKDIGCYNVTLNVWECNPTAKEFYEAMGMQVQKTGMEMVL